MKYHASGAVFFTILSLATVAAAQPDLSTLPPAARAAAALVPSCIDPTTAEMLKDAFNHSLQAQTSHLIAVMVDDPSEVAPDSVLAKRLDSGVPIQNGSAALRYCKALLELNNASKTPEIFRIDIHPDGRTPVVGANLTRELFEDPALSLSLPSRPAAGAPPITINSATPLHADANAAASISVSRPAQPAMRSSGRLPDHTVLCAAESDYVLRQQDMARAFPTHKIGQSCFYLTDSATFAVLDASIPTRVQVRLTSGDHAGAVAWTDASTAR